MAQVFAGKRQRCIGILREVKNKWERRVPLIPSAVAHLTKSGVRVLVQPSTMRIYKDMEFKKAGAELVEDISAANTILGVKEFPLENLLPNKSYMIFSHTIKAQAYNMPFLDACLENQVRLFDYETIRSPALPGGGGGGRLVAFGKFAGYAGMIDAFRGVGERLLSLGYSSPFMGVSSSYMYPDLPTAKAAIKKAGDEIRQYGLPTEIAPMRFVFTGTGNVARGAQEIFELLPHKYVTPAELATLPHDPHVVYGCVVQAEDMVEPLDSGKKFNKQEYYESPHLYRPVFHEKIAPHMNVLVNCMYWDTRFPRLISLSQMKDLEHSYDSNPRGRTFLALADITCDLGGSVEFLQRSTTIDHPFFMHNALTDEVSTEIEGRGVLVLGTDNLPAEFPKDASQHFSQALAPFAGPLSECDPTKPFSEAGSYLPTELLNSCITADGKLTPSFEYIAKMRAAQTQSVTHHQKHLSKTAPSSTSVHVDLMLEGHLFDTGFINQVLDILEVEGEDFEVVQWVISPNRMARANNVSRAVIQVELENKEKLATLIEAVNTLAHKMPSAAAKLVQLTYDDKTRMYSGIIDERNKTTISFQANSRVPITATEAKVKPATHHMESGSAPSGASGSLSSTISRTMTKGATASSTSTKPKKKILVLGSGFVVGPLLEYMLRRPENSITVASAATAEGEKLVKPFVTAQTNAGSEVRVKAVSLDVSDAARLGALIGEHDIVVSLLPATLHPEVAQLAIASKKNMVTASYVSPPMKALNESAKQAGVTILNEIGLDPGLDHLACQEIIDAAHEKGSKVLSFQSLCGGLPAPEAANNPFAYKFSWSPYGMLLATQNTAVFRESGKPVELHAATLLTSAKPLDLNPAFRLEYYANRDSLAYEGIYGIPEVQNMFRGTIRFGGTARLLHGYAKMGLLSRATISPMPTDPTWQALMSMQLGCAPNDVRATVAQQLRLSGDFDAPSVDRIVESMEWLGLFSSSEALIRGGGSVDPSHSYTAMELLCLVLQEKLSYAPGERDMVVMYHEFLLAHKDGSKTIKRSSLISYGGDDAVTNTNPLIVNTAGGGGRKGYSAMSRTVGIPAGIATQMILDGKLPALGVCIPTARKIYEPILKELKQSEGIEFTEEDKRV